MEIKTHITLYILRSKTKKNHYVGITNELSRRLKEHNSTDSTVYKLLGDFDLIYTEDHPDYQSARKREKYFKSGVGREWVKSNLDTGPRRNAG